MDTELILGFENSKVEQGTFPQMMLSVIPAFAVMSV